MNISSEGFEGVILNNYRTHNYVYIIILKNTTNHWIFH